MSTAEHTFPLPEIETHKLDAVRDELRHQPAFARARDSWRAISWMNLVFAGMAGVCVAWWLTNRRD